MITLSAEEKRAMCSALAAELPKIRELLGATQEALASCAVCPVLPSPALKTALPR